MNAKQSKKLRRIALTQAVEQGLPYVQYDFKTYRKAFTKLTGEIVPYTVYTIYLEDSQRKIYKQLKKQFKEGK
jgi:hypothetical protein